MYGNKTDAEQECRMQGRILSDAFLFGICTAGNGKFRIDYKEYTIRPFEMIIVFPKHLMTLMEASADFNIETLSIPVGFIRSQHIVPDFDALKKIIENPRIKADRQKVDELLKLIEIMKDYSRSDPHDKRITDSLTTSFLMIAHTLARPEASTGDRALRHSSQERLTRKFFRLMLSNFEKKHTVSFYADKLCVTPKYMSMAVKAVTGHSAQQWINETIIMSAKQYLQTTDLTVQQISEKLHFQTSSSFVRFFRQHTGETPLVYRKTLH